MFVVGVRTNKLDNPLFLQKFKSEVVILTETHACKKDILNQLTLKSTTPTPIILNASPDVTILVGLGRSFFVCCLAHRGSTVGFLLLQCSSGVVRHPRDLQVSVATHFCRVLIFASS